MSRCGACDKVLTTPELLSDINDDFCWECLGASCSKYNILTDKQYQHGWLDIAEDVDKTNKCE